MNELYSYSYTLNLRDIDTYIEFIKAKYTLFIQTIYLTTTHQYTKNIKTCMRHCNLLAIYLNLDQLYKYTAYIMILKIFII